MFLLTSLAAANCETVVGSAGFLLGQDTRRRSGSGQPCFANLRGGHNVKAKSHHPPDLTQRLYTAPPAGPLSRGSQQGTVHRPAGQLFSGMTSKDFVVARIACLRRCFSSRQGTWLTVGSCRIWLQVMAFADSCGFSFTKGTPFLKRTSSSSEFHLHARTSCLDKAVV